MYHTKRLPVAAWFRMAPARLQRKNMAFESRFPRGTPFADFSHCPRCGGTSLAAHGGHAIRCAACGFEFYFNCASAVGALLLHHGKLILGVRARPPQQGMLDVPGGFIEYDETAEDALAREIAEELNIEIADPVYLTSAPNDYLYGGIHYKTIDLFFVCEVDEISTLKAGDDLASHVLVDPAELDPQTLAFDSCRAALRRLLEQVRR